MPGGWSYCSVQEAEARPVPESYDVPAGLPELPPVAKSGDLRFPDKARARPARYRSMEELLSSGAQDEQEVVQEVS